MAKKVINNAEEVMDAYAIYCMENMDMEDMMQLVYDSVYDDLERDYSDEYLIEAIENSGYLELLEEITYDVGI